MRLLPSRSAARNGLEVGGLYLVQALVVPH